jgi:ferredoxin--NADP+ reductase
MSDERFNATITEHRPLTEEYSVFRIVPDSGEVYDFDPGQYASLGLLPEHAEPGPDGAPPKMVLRPYSIASSNKEKAHLEFFIVRSANGAFTPLLWKAGEGGRIWLRPKPQGLFTFSKVPEGKVVIMVATGTGLAPFMSMVRSCRGGEKWRRCILISGGRHASDLGYCEEIEAISRIDPTIRYLPIVTREPEGSAWGGLRGRVTTLLDPLRFQELTGDALDPEESQVMLCGHGDMIESVKELLAPLGFRPHKKSEPGQIHMEAFH